MARPKIVMYAREFKPIDVVIEVGKWEGLYKCLKKAKQEGIESLLVHSPEVLGDTYEELVGNLSAIASYGLTLCVIPPEQVGYNVGGPGLEKN